MIQLPQVAPMNDSPLQSVLITLRRVRQDIDNLGSGSALEVLAAYQRWAGQAAESLGFIYDNQSIDLLVTTRRHWWLMDAFPIAGDGGSTLDAFRAEQRDRVRVLDALVAHLDALERVASDSPPLAILDTNMYMHQEQYFDEIDWAEVAGVERVRILVPIAVVGELDGLKRSARNETVSETNKEKLRTRARVTVKKLREMFVDPQRVVHAMPNVQYELLLNHRLHRPISDTDAEILDRALEVQRVLSRTVDVITDDGGMEFRAKVDGLRVVRPTGP